MGFGLNLTKMGFYNASSRSPSASGIFAFLKIHTRRTFCDLFFTSFTYERLLRRSAEPFAVPGVHDLRAEDVPAVGVQVRRRVELRARHELRAGGRGAQEGRRRDEAAVQRALPRRGGLRLQVSEEGREGQTKEAFLQQCRSNPLKDEA